MSKRTASTSSGVLAPKLGRPEDIEQTDIFNVRVDGDAMETLRVVSGSRTRVLQTYVLANTIFDRIEATISLDECFPALRFTSRTSSLFMSPAEFYRWCFRQDEWDQGPVNISELCRSEPNDCGGSRVVRYTTCFGGEEAESFSIPKCALDKLKEKSKYMCHHLRKIEAAQTAIDVMFQCIENAYLVQHELSAEKDTIRNQFLEVSRLVECFLPMSRVVDDFNSKLIKKGLTCPFNPFNLCTLCMGQKKYILANL